MMSFSRFMLVFGVLLCLAAPVAAQIPAPGFVVPVVVKAPGFEGSNWATDLFLTNLGDQNVVFSAHYFPEKSANTFSGNFAKTNITLQKGRTLQITDVVGTWFPGQGANTKGWLLLADTTPVNCNADERDLAQVIVAARVYNSAGGGATYGMIVESSLLSINASPFPSVFTGIRHQGSTKPGFRTSVGVANLSTSLTTVEITLYDKNGSVRGQVAKDVKPLSLMQWTLDKLGFPVLGSQGGRLEVAIVNPNFDPCSEVAGTGVCFDVCDSECGGKISFGPVKAIVPYVSNTDNLTGDGETILPVIDQLGFYNWANEFTEANCPDDEKGSPLLKQFINKVDPYLDGRREPPPVFRKIVE